MISPDCEKCEMLDLENKDCPCKLEYPIRCSILHEYYKAEMRKELR